MENQKKGDLWFPIFCIVMVLLLLLNTFVIKLAVVDGQSMYPTLHDRDLLLVFRWGYQPQQGDVVVIHTGKSLLSRDYIVKRVIAVAGETVVIDYEENTVTVEGVTLSEPYMNLAEEDPMLPRDQRTEVSYTVPEGCVFVLGDNRNHSADSRSEKYRTIEQKQIVGRAMLPQIYRKK